MVNSLLFSQQPFEFERTWGTYFGPAGTQMAGIYHQKGILFDSQKNMYMRGSMWNYSNFPASYFNQFLLGGGTSITNPPQHNRFEAAVSAQGTPFFFGFYPYFSGNRLEAIDSQNHQYRILYGSSLPVQATPNVFLPNDPDPSSPKKILLAKYSSAGTLAWATYLPSSHEDVQVITDPTGNVYISNKTLITSNITTTGVWQENFDIFYDPQGMMIPNYYLLKLNPDGQRIWASYLPSGVEEMLFHNNALYIRSGRNTNPNLNTMATPGAYQTTLADLSITKIDVAAGNRLWGTYYGTPMGNNMEVATGMAINETGIYITGTDYNYTGLNFFGNPASYKQTVEGGSDLFLFKFSLSGMWEWSTYFGSSGTDMNHYDKTIALNGNEVYITGNSYGNTNNIATTGSHQEFQELNTANAINHYFAKFNSSGNFIWCSYYGGTSFSHIDVPLNIAIDNGVLFLFGNTNSNTGYTTEGAWMPQRVPQSTGNDLTSFIARFDNKSLSTSEVRNTDLQMYNNPNDGNFYLSGDILKKDHCIMAIYNAAGRIVKQETLSKEETQYFPFEGNLLSGVYFVTISHHDRKPIKTFKMMVK